MENCILCDKRPPVGLTQVCQRCFTNQRRITIKKEEVTRKKIEIEHTLSVTKVRTPKPTEALPGTKEKIKVLQGRVERGEELWHPLDARCSGSLPEGVRLLERENRMKASTNKKQEMEENRRRYRADGLAWLPFLPLDYNNEDDTELED